MNWWLIDFLVVQHVLKRYAKDDDDSKPAESQPTAPAVGVDKGQEWNVLDCLLSLAPTVSYVRRMRTFFPLPAS